MMGTHTHTPPRIHIKLKTGTERLLVCGQALSHCVNYTVRDILDNWPPNEANRITILADCASSVPGFEAAGEAFLGDMAKAGVIVGTSGDAFGSPVGSD